MSKTKNCFYLDTESSVNSSTDRSSFVRSSVCSSVRSSVRSSVLNANSSSIERIFATQFGRATFSSGLSPQEAVFMKNVSSFNHQLTSRQFVFVLLGVVKRTKWIDIKWIFAYVLFGVSNLS